MLKHGILGLLNYGDMTGYDIMEVFRDSLNYFWTAKTSQIYRELQTLNEKGFATVMLVNQQDRPDKKVYSITEKGRTELKEWLRGEEFVSRVNFPLMMKIFFAGEITKEENIEQFHHIREKCRQTLMEINEVKPNVCSYEKRISDEDRAQYWYMTMDFGIRYTKMLNEWCDDCIKKLEEKEK